ncbi:hypothetical protein C6P40_002667, partial [Pichia californica]
MITAMDSNNPKRIYPASNILHISSASTQFPIVSSKDTSASIPSNSANITHQQQEHSNIVGTTRAKKFSWVKRLINNNNSPNNELVIVTPPNHQKKLIKSN